MRSPGATVRKRLVLLMGGFFLLFLCVCVRLVDLQIVRQKELTARGVKQWTRSGVVSARRGDIVDTNGKLLAQSVTSFILTARPRDVKNVNALAGVLARELGLSEETIIKKLSGSKAASVTLARQISREDADRLRAIRQSAENPDSDALIGITFDEDVSRWYPMGTLLAQVLGLCNVDGEGQSGLELKYNDELSGKPGRIVTEVDARARTLPDGVTLYVPAEQGHTPSADHRPGCSGGGGARRARMRAGQRRGERAGNRHGCEHRALCLPWRCIRRTIRANPPRDDLDRLNELMRLTVLGDVYEPGSTFKMLTASAAIDCGATSPQEGFYCSGKITVDGSTVRCWGAPHGTETMARALENSCNPVFTQLALRLGSERFYQYLHAFGLGSRTGIDLYGEASGILIGQNRVKNVDLARIGFGQSVAVTPIQMITAACAVVNGGRLMKPYLVEAIEDSDGNVLKQTSPKVVSTPISAETSATMRKLLYGVVENGGGKNAKVNGYAIGGKTGTAQIYRNGKIESNLHIGSFVGFAPADNPRVALLVTVNEAKVKPDYGGTTAAPFAAQIFEEILPLLGVAKTEGGAEAKQTTMPDVTGMNVRDAKAILREAGIDAVTDGENPIVTRASCLRRARRCRKVSARCSMSRARARRRRRITPACGRDRAGYAAVRTGNSAQRI